MSTVTSEDVNEQLGSLLEHMTKINASDLHLVAGHPPVFRVDDVSYPARVPLESDDIASMAGSLMSELQREHADSASETTVTFPWFDDRFRACIFSQRGTLAIAVRRLSPLRTLDALGHGPQLHKLALITRGLVLVAGGKRSGRSTTLAAMIDHRNTAQPGHILTIEDPIEHVHTHKQCIVTQREVGTDTRSFASALRSAPSLAPDLILVSELRDVEAAEAVLALADAGYACFSTLHATNSSHAVERLIGMFPAARHEEIRARLARTLRAVVAQRLVPAVPEGRVAATEVLLDTPAVRELLRRGDLDLLGRMLDQESAEGCQSFDASLLALCSVGRVSPSEVVKAADHASDLLQRLQRSRDSGRTAPPLRLAPEPKLR